jgi:hypothetical protein
MALVVALCLLAGSLWITHDGYPWVGGILGGTTVVSLAGTFVVGKWQQKKDLAEKRSGTQSRKPRPGRG